MSIQIDNGDFTRLHNTILEGMAKSRFTALEFRCLLYLVRMTYGWQKKEDAISLSQWAKGIGLDKNNRGNMLNVLNGLVSQGVIYKHVNDDNQPAIWGLNKAYFEDESVMQPHNTPVMPEHNTLDATVMQPHNRGVMQPHNESVMQPHNNKRKKESSKEKGESVAAQPTPQQEMFGAICEAIGWDHRVITKRNKEQVAQAVKILTENDYTVDDIRHFMTEVWFKDWRWEKKRSPPTLTQLREDIGKIRSLLNGAAPPKEKGIDGYKAMLARQGIDL